MTICFPFRLLLGLLLAALALPAPAQQRPLPDAAPASAGQPLSEALNPDGTLRPSASGSFDPKGYRLVRGKNGQPAFRPAGAGDQYWQDGFGLPGTDGEVMAMAVASTGEIYIGGWFTIAGDVAAHGIAQWDGTTWSALGTGLSGGSGFPYANSFVNALAVMGTTLYVGGDFTSAGGVPANHIARWDGTTWSALGTGLDSTVSALVVSGPNLYAGGSFTTAGGVPANHIVRWDGTTWSSLGTGVGGSQARVRALAIMGADLYVGGDFTSAGGGGANHIARWDGTTWNALGTGLDSTVNALAVIGTDLYAGGVFDIAGGGAARHIARWDGTTWHPLGTGVNGSNNDYVSALTVAGPDLYVGGHFVQAGGVHANNIAKWDGTAWSALGAGVDANVFALGVVGAALYAGGGQSGLVYGNIFRWNGTTREWDTLGAGLNGPVYALAVAGPNLYVGGDFTSAGGVPANHIARWDGTTWHALGTGLNNLVFALLVVGPDLYAGGYFTSAGGVAANHLARWDGTTWHALGAGVDANVFALGAVGPDLYAGGYFTSAGGVPANNIARWDGTTWHALGTGLDGGVRALAGAGPDLYVGGYFTQAGGVAANNIARWDGTTWHALGMGIDSIQGTVYALAVAGADLYVGGDFTTAGGVLAEYVARWDGTTWNGLGTNMTNGDFLTRVTSLAVVGADLYVGGEFSWFDTTASDHIVRWDGTSWRPVGTGLNDDVEALAAANGKVYAGGLFFGTADGSKATAFVGIYTPPGPTQLPEDLTPTTFALYPNPIPTTSRVNVATDQPGAPVQLLDLTGRLVRSQPADATGQALLDVGGVAPGLYLVRCGTATRRLVVE